MPQVGGKALGPRTNESLHTMYFAIFDWDAGLGLVQAILHEIGNDSARKEPLGTKLDGSMPDGTMLDGSRPDSMRLDGR